MLIAHRVVSNSVEKVSKLMNKTSHLDHFDGNNCATTKIVFKSAIHSLPQEDDGKSGVLDKILEYLDIHSTCKFIILSSLGKQFRATDKSGAVIYTTLDRCTAKVVQYRERLMDHLTEKYKKQFPKGTPFIIACEKGCLNDVKSFVKHHRYMPSFNGESLQLILNTEGKNSEGHERTGLGAAVMAENVETIRYLVSLPHINVCACDRGGCNPLHYAAGFNESTDSIMKMLIAHPTCTKKSINLQDKYGSTPLDKTCKHNNGKLKDSLTEILKLHGGKKKSELEALINAVRKENCELVKKLLLQDDTVDVARCDSYGRNALHWAAEKNRKTDEIMKALLNHPSCTYEAINEKDRYVYGFTPLDWAFSFNGSMIKASLVKLLKSKGGKRASDLNGNRYIKTQCDVKK